VLGASPDGTQNFASTPQPGYDVRTVQRVASRYAEYAIPAAWLSSVDGINFGIIIVCVLCVCHNNEYLCHRDAGAIHFSTFALERLPEYQVSCQVTQHLLLIMACDPSNLTGYLSAPRTILFWGSRSRRHTISGMWSLHLIPFSTQDKVSIPFPLDIHPSFISRGCLSNKLLHGRIYTILRFQNRLHAGCFLVRFVVKWETSVV
jgi:hypothetical protein